MWGLTICEVLICLAFHIERQKEEMQPVLVSTGLSRLASASLVYSMYLLVCGCDCDIEQVRPWKRIS